LVLRAYVPFERQLLRLSRLPTRNGKWLVDIAWVEPRLFSENAILLCVYIAKYTYMLI
jgi:hypothetical protein